MIDSLPILLKAIFTHPIFYSLLLADDFEDHDFSNLKVGIQILIFHPIFNLMNGIFMRLDLAF